MQKVLVLVTCLPGKAPDLLIGLRSALAEARSQKGCLSIDVYVDADDPKTVVILHEWESRGHFEQWIDWEFKSGLHDALMRFLSPLVAEPLKLLYLKTSTTNT